MSPGSVRSVLFVDLDGTLLLENSFHAFVMELWAGSGALTRLRLVWILLRRGLGHHDARVTAKYRIMQLYEELGEAERTQVVESLLPKLQESLSEPVMRMVEAWSATGAYVILATAAPAAYAEPLAATLGIDSCLGTPDTTSAEWAELIGGTKARACRRWIEHHQVLGRIGVASDHPDDIPLLRIADEILIQCPRELLDEILEGLPPGKQITHVDPTVQQPSGGYWLWLDGRVLGPLDSWEVQTITSKYRYALIYHGQGSWIRAWGSGYLSNSARREDRPVLPSAFSRLRITVRRRVVRGRLRIYH